MKRAEQKSKAPHRRKPAHQAPIHRGSSGVMVSLPVERQGRSQYTERGGGTHLKEHRRGIELTGVDEDGVHIELSAE